MSVYSCVSGLHSIDGIALSVSTYILFPSSPFPSTFPSQSIYAKAHQLMEEAKELSVAGLVNPDLMEDEVSTLEIAFGGFANQLDERREIILLAKDLHNRLDRVSALCSCCGLLLVWIVNYAKSRLLHYIAAYIYIGVCMSGVLSVSYSVSCV